MSLARPNKRVIGVTEVNGAPFPLDRYSNFFGQLNIAEKFPELGVTEVNGPLKKECWGL